MPVVLASDTFSRTNQSTWGTASDTTDVWSVVGGSSTNFSIVSNEGQITNSTAVQQAYLGTLTAADVEGLVRVTTTANGDTPALCLRGTAANTCYRFRMKNPNIDIVSVVAGVTTTVGSVAFSRTAGTPYWIRGRVVGTNFYMKVWADGSGEPAAWTLTATDSTITSAGKFGLEVALNAVGNTALFDSFQVFQVYTLTEQAQEKFYTQMLGLNTRARSSFYTRMNGLNTRARSQFLTRMVGLSATSRVKFFTKFKGLKVRMQSQFPVQMKGLGGQGRTKFFTRMPLSSAVRSKFFTRASLASRALSKFLVLVTFKTPLKATFGAATQKLNATFAEAILARPFSTITVPATLTDASGSLITTASASVLITFPDGSTQTISASNQGAGVYQIQYNTKTQGLTREVWSFTGSDGSIAQYTNITPVSS